MIRAAVFLPTGPMSDRFALQGIAHCTHRDYQFSGLVRNWESALAMLHDGLVSVIVFARPEHWDETWEPRIEFCGEVTQALFRQAPGPEVAKSTGRHRPRIVG